MREGAKLARAFLLVWCLLMVGACEKAPVRMSEANICHDASSPNYERMKHFVEYATMAECQDAGGRKRKDSAPDRRPPYIIIGVAVLGLVLFALRRWRAGGRR